MITQLIVLFVELIIFLLLAVIVFYPFGFLVIDRSKTKLKKQETIILSLLISMVAFVLFSVVIGLLNVRFLLLPTIIVVAVYALFKHGKKMFSPWRVLLEDKILLSLIIIAIIIQGFINFPSGFNYGGDLLFWSSQGHDGIWHVALMEEMKKSFPIINPLFGNHPLYNYHYLFDIVLGEFGRIFSFFSSLDLYFRFFPVYLSFLISLSVFSFVTRWKDNRFIGYWAIFFTSLAGSFGYIVVFIKHGRILGGETVFWASQGNTILGNPPHASSYALIPGFFLCLYFLLKTRSKYWFWITFFIVMVLGGFKVSAGLVVILGLGFAAVIELITTRRTLLLKLAFLIGVSNLIAVNLMTKGVTSFLIFEPWWFIRTMVVSGDRLDWIDLEHKRQHYLYVGRFTSYLRVIQVETTAFLIFLLGNLGTKVIGFFELVKRVFFETRSLFKDSLEIALIASMLASFLMPLLFVQRGITFNNIQFLQYFLMIFGFYAAISTYRIYKKIKNNTVRFLFVLFIVLLSIPTVLGNLVDFYGRGNKPLAKVSQSDLVALEYLKENTETEALVLTVPFDQYLKTNYKEPPLPIYAWYSTSYLPAIASRRSYLTSEEQVLITGYPLEERLENINRFFEQEDSNWNKEFVKREGIDYVYVARDEFDHQLNIAGDYLEVFYENDAVVIYKVI